MQCSGTLCLGLLDLSLVWSFHSLEYTNSRMDAIHALNIVLKRSPIRDLACGMTETY